MCILDTRKTSNLILKLPYERKAFYNKTDFYSQFHWAQFCVEFIKMHKIQQAAKNINPTIIVSMKEKCGISHKL